MTDKQKYRARCREIIIKDLISYINGCFRHCRIERNGPTLVMYDTKGELLMKQDLSSTETVAYLQGMSDMICIYPQNF